jgi:hypothetical protein
MLGRAVTALSYLALAGACSSSGDSARPDAFTVEPGNLFETAGDFPREVCAAGSLAAFDPAGRWRVDREDGAQSLNASYFRDDMGQLTALLALEPVTLLSLTDDDLLARQVQGTEILAIDLCARQDDEHLLGYLGECLDGSCQVTGVEAVLIGPVTE